MIGFAVRRLAIAIALLAALLWAVDASAASVLLVVPPSPSPAMAEAIVRVRGELIAEGFQVQVMDGMPGKDGMAGSTGGEGGGHEALEQLAKMRKADAVVAILGDETPDAVEIWVVDKATQKTVMRRIPFQSQPDHGSKTFAIHTLELLRGSLLELDLRPDDQPREARPIVVATVSESPGPGNQSGRFGVQVGAAGVIGFGDLGPMVLPIVRLGWALSPSVIALLAAAGYGSRASVAFDGASARASEQFALVGALTASISPVSVGVCAPTFLSRQGCFTPAQKASPIRCIGAKMQACGPFCSMAASGLAWCLPTGSRSNWRPMRKSRILILRFALTSRWWPPPTTRVFSSP